MNNKSIRIIILAGTFVAFFALSFFGIRLIKDSSSEQEVIKHEESEYYTQETEPVTVSDVPETPNTPAIANRTQPSTPEKTEEPKAQITIKKGPEPNGETYEFSVSAKNIPQEDSCHFELVEGDNVILSSNNGNFTGVPGNDKGKYTVRLVDSNGNKLAFRTVSGFKLPKSSEPDTVKSSEPKNEKPEKRLITPEDFHKCLLDLNDDKLIVARRATDKKTVLAYGFKVIVDSASVKATEKKIPSDLEGVREKISFGTWKSAQIIGIVYDEKTGQVKYVKVKPVY